VPQKSSSSRITLELILKLLRLDLFTNVPEYFLPEFFFLDVLAHDCIHEIVPSQFLDKQVKGKIITSQLPTGHILEKLVDFAHFLIAVRILDD
jgi:hypothetical protein